VTEQNQNTALARRSMGYGAGGIQIRTFDDLQRMGKVFADSGLFKDVGDVARAIVKIQYGAELGLSPMVSMTAIYVVEGKPSLSAGAIAARIKGCVLEWSEDGEVLGESKFLVDDARRAGVLGKNNWKSWPAAMYFARALTIGARMHCPDVFFGAVYTPEELSPDAVDVDQNGNVVSIRDVNPPPSAADPASSTRSGSEKLRQAAAAAQPVEVVVEQAAGIPVTVLADVPAKEAEVIADAVDTMNAAPTGEAPPAEEPAPKKARAKKQSNASTPTDAGDGSAAGSPPASAPPAATTSAPAETAPPATSSSTDQGDDDEDPFGMGDEPAPKKKAAYNVELARACAMMPKVKDELSPYAAKWRPALNDEEFGIMRAWGRKVFNEIKGNDDTHGMPPEETPKYEIAKALVAAYKADHPTTKFP
jgi:hypothetical protein